MILIDETDFTPLDEFPLLWRWTSAKYTQLPAPALRSIRPLSRARAAELAPLALARCVEDRDRRGATQIQAVTETEETVRAALQALGVPDSTAVLVSWDEATAVVTSWNVFVHYWADFCYPSSDDVTIVPLNGTWTLCYDHSGMFEFEPAVRAA